MVSTEFGRCDCKGECYNAVISHVLISLIYMVRIGEFARLPDLTPLDFYKWSYLKRKVVNSIGW